MPDSVPLPVSSPPPPPPRTVGFREFVASSLPKKTQEDLNVEVYESVFKKCMDAAERILHGRVGSNADRDNQVKIASAIFDRFYNDQTAIKAGENNAKAMIDGMTQVLEGRR